MLPAPIFRATAALQATRRLGLTATLVREDGKEEDVFSLVGPKAYEVPWKKLENRGYLAKALCTEIRVELDSFLKKNIIYLRPTVRCASLKKIQINYLLLKS